MQLIIAKPSPFARKVRIAMRENGLTYEEVISNPWMADALAPIHNPLGKVPVLLLDDRPAIYESSVIIDFLQTLEGVDLIPTDPVSAIAARQCDALAMGICDAVVLLIMEGQREVAAQSDRWIARQKAKVDTGVVALSTALGEDDWLVGGTITIADIAAGCALAYLDLRLPNFEWRQRFPNLLSYSDRLEARPSFQATRPETQEINSVA